MCTRAGNTQSRNIYIYIYIYRERERYVYIYIYIVVYTTTYIYIYTYRHGDALCAARVSRIGVCEKRKHSSTSVY